MVKGRKQKTIEHASAKKERERGGGERKVVKKEEKGDLALR